MNEIYTLVESPVGELLLGSAGRAPLRRLWFIGAGVDRAAGVIDPQWRRDDDAFAEVDAQLREYFGGSVARSSSSSS